MKPVAIFYHCYFESPERVLNLNATEVVFDQMHALTLSGLADYAHAIFIGLNGDRDSQRYAQLMCPAKSTYLLHGLDSRCENPTIYALEQWLPEHPGWYVLYFHAKGASHPPGSTIGLRWRSCMMRHCVENWRRCLLDLDAGYESVGAHWLTKMCDGSQNYWGGNFWWAKSDFLATLPSIMLRGCIKAHGLKAHASRYEAEVWIGNGPRLPRIKDYHPGFNCAA
jgi:hypothetical protein